MRKVRIGDFLFERKGKYKPSDKAIQCLKRIEKIDFGGNFHIGDKSSNTNMILVKQGDLVISGINVAKGAMGIYDMKDDVVATIHYSSYTFDKEKINVGFFKRFLKSAEFMRLLSEQIKGGIKTEIKPKHILPLEINLPNMEIQNDIVAKFENVETDIENLNGEVDNQQILLRKLRQSILQEAIEGELTASWREQNPDIESASVLLEKIKAGKEQLIKEKKIKKQKPLAPISEDEIPFDIPDSWEWCKLGTVSSKIGSGSTPRGSNYSESGTPFFRSQNIYNHGLIYNDIKYISDETHTKMSGTKVVAEDILLNITGGSMGRCAYVPKDFNCANLSQHVCIIRPIVINPIFLHNLVLSPIFQDMIFSSTTGAGREGLPKNNLEQFVIPIIPLEEQKEIVKKIENLFKICDELETQINSSKTNSQTLMQAVLKEAFES